MAYDRYLPGSGFMGSGVFLGVVPYGDISAVSVYSLSPTPYLVLYNSLTNKIGKYDIDDKILTYPSGWYTPGGDITSLKHNTDYSMFYACHSHYIYKFGSDFNLLESYNTFPSGTNLAGIAYEYEYEERIEHIWAISNNGAQKIIYDITNF